MMRGRGQECRGFLFLFNTDIKTMHVPKKIIAAPVCLGFSLIIPMPMNMTKEMAIMTNR